MNENIKSKTKNLEKHAKYEKWKFAQILPRKYHKKKGLQKSKFKHPESINESYYLYLTMKVFWIMPKNKKKSHLLFLENPNKS